MHNNNYLCEFWLRIRKCCDTRLKSKEKGEKEMKCNQKTACSKTNC